MTNGMKELTTRVVNTLDENNTNLAPLLYLLTETWYFLNSDTAKVNDKPIEGFLFREAIIISSNYLDLDIEYCKTNKGLALLEIDFLEDYYKLLEGYDYTKLKLSRQRKFKEFRSIIKSKIDNYHIVQHPFSSDGNFKIFQYLDTWFKDASLAKYTYIYDFIKDHIESTLNEREYFIFVKKHKSIQMTERSQPSAISPSKREKVKQLYEQYQKEFNLI